MSYEFANAFVNSALYEWAIDHKLQGRYELYEREVTAIEEECVAEGYPRNGEIFDMCREELRKDFPEFFDPDFEEEDLESLREYRSDIFDDYQGKRV